MIEHSGARTLLHDGGRLRPELAALERIERSGSARRRGAAASSSATDVRSWRTLLRDDAARPARAERGPAGGAALHLGHHRHAQGRAAQPRQSLRQSSRARGGAPGQARRSGPAAAAAASRLPAHRRAAGTARDRRRGDPAGRDHRPADHAGAAGPALHHHDRGAAPVRGDARRHRASDRRRAAPDRRRHPRPARCLDLGAPPAGLADRQAAVLSAAPPHRPGAAPARLGRRPPRPGGGVAARGPRLGGADRLWPDRDRADPHLQPAGPGADRERRPAGGGRRAAPRARPRTPRRTTARSWPRARTCSPAIGTIPRPPRRRSPTTASFAPATSAISTTTAISHRRPQQGADHPVRRREHLPRGCRGGVRHRRAGPRGRGAGAQGPAGGAVRARARRACAAASSEDLHQHFRREVERPSPKLPSYARIGDFAITAQPLPRTQIGKLRRHELPEIFEQEKSGAGRPEPPAAATGADRALLETPPADRDLALARGSASRATRSPSTPARSSISASTPSTG